MRPAGSSESAAHRVADPGARGVVSARCGGADRGDGAGNGGVGAAGQAARRCCCGPGSVGRDGPGVGAGAGADGGAGSGRMDDHRAAEGPGAAGRPAVAGDRRPARAGLIPGTGLTPRATPAVPAWSSTKTTAACSTSPSSAPVWNVNPKNKLSRFASTARVRILSVADLSSVRLAWISPAATGSSSRNSGMHSSGRPLRDVFHPLIDAATTAAR
jgi:hypothetical protein